VNKGTDMISGPREPERTATGSVAAVAPISELLRREPPQGETVGSWRAAARGGVPHSVIFLISQSRAGGGPGRYSG
jgi:hypothetical protein